jgi:hypothetical protein
MGPPTTLHVILPTIARQSFFMHKVMSNHCASNPINTYIAQKIHPPQKHAFATMAFVAWVIMIIHILQHILNSTLEPHSQLVLGALVLTMCLFVG